MAARSTRTRREYYRRGSAYPELVQIRVSAGTRSRIERLSTRLDTAPPEWLREVLEAALDQAERIT